MKNTREITWKIGLATVLGLIAAPGWAQALGQVISSTAIIQRMAVPRQVCTTVPAAVQAPKTGAGAVMGAIAGGVVGNAVGSGGGRVAATMLGVMGGAVLGDRIENTGATHIENVQRCEIQTFYENHTVAYDVVYEYAGKRYAVQMQQDPGPRLQLQVIPVGTSAQVPSDMTAQPIYLQPSPVMVGAPVYYPPIAIQFGWGYWGASHYRR